MAYKHINKLCKDLNIVYEKIEIKHKELAKIVSENGATEEQVKFINSSILEPSQLLDSLSYFKTNYALMFSENSIHSYKKECLDSGNSYKTLLSDYNELLSENKEENEPIIKNMKTLLKNLRDRYKMTVFVLYLCLKPKRDSRSKSINYDKNFYKIYADKLGFSYTEFLSFVEYYLNYKPHLEEVLNSLINISKRLSEKDS